MFEAASPGGKMPFSTSARMAVATRKATLPNPHRRGRLAKRNAFTSCDAAAQSQPRGRGWLRPRRARSPEHGSFVVAENRLECVEIVAPSEFLEGFSRLAMPQVALQHFLQRRLELLD